MKIQRYSGFTLIELMIVIAIVAILVALAVPAYKDYTIRTKVAECISSAAVPKLQISEYHTSIGRYPTNEVMASTQAPAGYSEFCLGFNYPPEIGTEGWFYVLINESAIDSSNPPAQIEPRMDPTLNAGNGDDWNCSRGQTSAASLKYLPATCRESDV